VATAEEGSPKIEETRHGHGAVHEVAQEQCRRRAGARHGGGHRPARVLDILGTTAISAAILLTLALLATTLLRDRQLATHALRDVTTVRILTGGDVGQALEEARRLTDQWMFKGGTGTFLRAVTLPRCVEIARRERRPLRFQIEVIDPSNEEVCTTYTRFRRSLSTRPDGTGEPWTPERTRKESYATVLAACWYLQRFAWLSIEMGLSATMSTFRWDLSTRCVIITQEDRPARR